jgi:hypothetical protein
VTDAVSDATNTAKGKFNGYSQKQKVIQYETIEIDAASYMYNVAATDSHEGRIKLN